MSLTHTILAPSTAPPGGPRRRPFRSGRHDASRADLAGLDAGSRGGDTRPGGVGRAMDRRFVGWRS